MATITKAPSMAFLEFFGAVLEAAAFTGSHYETAADYENGSPVPFDSTGQEIPKEIENELRADALYFWRANARFIASRPAQAGHDFHLTRNGHGAGFWDGDWPDGIGKYLTRQCKPYGSAEIESGPDGVWLTH